MPKVYVTQENRNLNYMDAERFGTVVFLTADEYSPNPNSKRNQSIENDFIGYLKDFNFKEDYLLLSGDPVLIALSILSLSKFHTAFNYQDKINLLKWDGISKKYNPISIDLVPF